MNKREHLIGKWYFECFDVDIYEWSSPDKNPVSLVLYPKELYDEEGDPAGIELTLEDIDEFCDTLQACKKSMLGEEL